MRTDPYGDPEDYQSDRPAWLREPGVVVLVALAAVGLLMLAVAVAVRALGRVGG